MADQWFKDCLHEVQLTQDKIISIERETLTVMNEYAGKLDNFQLDRSLDLPKQLRKLLAEYELKANRTPPAEPAQVKPEWIQELYRLGCIVKEKQSIIDSYERMIERLQKMTAKSCESAEENEKAFKLQHQRIEELEQMVLNLPAFNDKPAQHQEKSVNREVREKMEKVKEILLLFRLNLQEFKESTTTQLSNIQQQFKEKLEGDDFMSLSIFSNRSLQVVSPAIEEFDSKSEKVSPSQTMPEQNSESSKFVSEMQNLRRQLEESKIKQVQLEEYVRKTIDQNSKFASQLSLLKNKEIQHSSVQVTKDLEQKWQQERNKMMLSLTTITEERDSLKSETEKTNTIHQTAISKLQTTIHHLNQQIKRLHEEFNIKVQFSEKLLIQKHQKELQVSNNQISHLKQQLVVQESQSQKSVKQIEIRLIQLIREKELITEDYERQFKIKCQYFKEQMEKDLKVKSEDYDKKTVQFRRRIDRLVDLLIKTLTRKQGPNEDSRKIKLERMREKLLQDNFDEIDEKEITIFFERDFHPGVYYEREIVQYANHIKTRAQTYIKKFTSKT